VLAKQDYRPALDFICCLWSIVQARKHRLNGFLSLTDLMNSVLLLSICNLFYQIECLWISACWGTRAVEKENRVINLEFCQPCKISSYRCARSICWRRVNWQRVTRVNGNPFQVHHSFFSIHNYLFLSCGMDRRYSEDCACIPVVHHIPFIAPPHFFFGRVTPGICRIDDPSQHAHWKSLRM
jgi:hypothetical protein